MMPQVGNDGHNGQKGPQSFMDQAMGWRAGADVAKYFVEAGKDFMDLLFRCKFQSTRERKAFIELAHGCIEFKDDAHLTELTMYLAGSDSENADRIERFLAGITAGASRTGGAKPGGRGLFDNVWPKKKGNKQDMSDGN